MIATLFQIFLFFFYIPKEHLFYIVQKLEKTYLARKQVFDCSDIRFSMWQLTAELGRWENEGRT